MDKPLRVLLLEDSTRDAASVTAELERGGMRIVTDRVDTKEAFAAALRDFLPDVVLSELELGGFTASAALEMVRSITPATPMIVVSGGCDGGSAVACVRAGVEDVILKDDLSRLSLSIDAAIAMRRRLGKLSPRQIQVLRLVAEGNTTRVIANRLQLSAKTVDTHRGEAMKRLGIHDVVTLVRYAVRVGLVSLEDHPLGARAHLTRAV